jgi:hypothetical protein
MLSASIFALKYTASQLGRLRLESEMLTKISVAVFQKIGILHLNFHVNAVKLRSGLMFLSAHSRNTHSNVEYGEHPLYTSMFSGVHRE